MDKNEIDKDEKIFPILSLSEDSTDNKYLIKSKNLANRVMEQISCREVIFKFNVDQKRCKEMIGKVKIAFTNQDSEKEKIIYQENVKEADKKVKEFLGWTYRDTNASELHINKIFEKRLNKTKDKQEKKIIIVYMAIVILHEVAHLLFRWSGLNNTPKSFRNLNNMPEAGSNFESRLFGCEIASAIEQINKNDKWTEDQPFIGKILIFENDTLDF
jgi:hypothetical protein